MARAGGRELFYLDLDSSMMSVVVQTTGEFKASPPARLFATNMAADPMEPQYGVTSDGQRFLGLEREPGGTRFVYLLNWLSPDRSKDASSQ